MWSETESHEPIYWIFDVDAVDAHLPQRMPEPASYLSGPAFGTIWLLVYCVSGNGVFLNG
ncbi:hypothetical protein LY76DRAFT_593560 [Colletotrichum caudatum]|nr:hypothetical protein LY76DRAFT_593560 [Colletotrichum caudatum]